MTQCRHHILAGIGLSAFMAGGVVQAAAPLAPGPGAQAAWVLHLLGQARYDEAMDAVQTLIGAAPNAAPSYELRGTLALEIGNFARAQDDFQTAASHAPQEPAVLYGLGLCALSARRWDAADTDFTQAGQASGLTPAQATDLDTARAYVAYLHSGPAEASLPAVSAGENGSLRQEIAAMIAARDHPDTAEALLTRFLATPTGVPHVHEEEGIRALFDPATPIEATVFEPTMQQLYGQRLVDRMTDAAHRQGRMESVSGTVTLNAKGAEQASVVSFSIDGQGTMMLNHAPFSYTWNTRLMINGIHTVQIEADDAEGHTLATQTETVRVANADSMAPDTGQDGFTPAEYAQTQAGIWNLLRLRPACKVAEWTLATRLAARGDMAEAQAHRLVAAALDPDYKDARHIARQMLGAAARQTAFVPQAIRVAAARPVSLWRGSKTRKQVALTFDDGPNPDKTPALLAALAEADAPATFFVVGARAEAAPDLVRQMARQGDEVENHSYTHPNMDQADPIVVEEELLRNCVVVQALTGRAPRFFRPPGGDGGPAVMALAGDYGLTGAFWTLDALPAEDQASVPGLVHYVVSRIHPGSIVLMHNAPDVTTAALPAIIAGLRAKGYQLVTLADLARSGAAVKAPAAAKAEKE